MPPWEDTTPYTERRTRVTRLSWTNVLILLHLAAFVATVFLTRENRHALAFLEFSARGALDELRVWQLITYSFVQTMDGPGYLPLLMLGLYVLYTLGNELEQEIGARRYLLFTLAFAAYGAPFHGLHQYFSRDLANAAGILAPVAGIAALSALRWPHRPVLFLFVLPMRLRLAVVLMAAAGLSYAAFFFPQGLGPAIGAAAAAVAVHLLEPRLDRAFEKAAQRRERDLFLEEVEVRRRTEEILEKIARAGMDTLNPGERRTLKKASAILRRQKAVPHE